MEKGKTYYVGEDNGVSDLDAFVNQRRESDFFVVCIGLSNVGKSSLMRLLLNMMIIASLLTT
jgi:GTP-binding protein EngB required for normal cell division